jgi:transcriptional regulator with XRE-family HTH domain
MGRRNVSQVQLATGLGFTQAAVSRRLTGKTSFNVDELVAVAALLGVPVSQLTAGLDAEIGAA